MNEGQHWDEGARGGERDYLGEVIRVAGKRVSPSSEATAVARAAVTAAWERKTARTRRRRRWTQWGAIAATLAIAAGIWVQMPASRSASVATTYRVIGEFSILEPGDTGIVVPDDRSDIRAGARLQTGERSYAGLRLSGGTSLRIGERTQVVMHSADVIELLEGRLYIDTFGEMKHDPAVRIKTSRGVFRDTGTQFEIGQDEQSVRLRVREGIVAFADGAVNAVGSAGEEVLIDAGGNISRSRISRHDPAWDWATRLAPSPGTSDIALDQLLDWVTRESGRDVRFADASVETQASRIRLHGRVDRLSPLEALDVMLATTDLTYELADDGSILIGANNRPDKGAESEKLFR